MTSPKDPMSVRVLLVSTDIALIETFCHLSQALCIHVEPCCDATSATRKLCHSKFEGVVVDLAAEGGSSLLKKLRTLTSNKSALSFAISPAEDDQTDRFFTSANFVIRRPVQQRALFRVLKAAYPMMVREKRRYFRYSVQTPVFLARGSNAEVEVKSLNISEGGMCLNCSTPIHVGDQLRLRLQLPGESEWLTLCGEVCWSEAAGRMGIQFVGLTNKAKIALQNWLAERLQEALTVPCELTGVASAHSNEM